MLRQQFLWSAAAGFGLLRRYHLAVVRTDAGSHDGVGGAVTATLTVDANGTVTDCKLEGAQETESIGGAALEELSKQVVAANGPAIDGVAGAAVTTKAVRKAVAAALGVELAEEAPADSAAAAPAEPAAIVPVAVSYTQLPLPTNCRVQILA